tara:strand:- start:3105 stop:3212 length:108 start_codon:yes stop_codon:yes gene_type:complete
MREILVMFAYMTAGAYGLALVIIIAYMAYFMFDNK